MIGIERYHAKGPHDFYEFCETTSIYSAGTSAESQAKKPPSEQAPATYQLTWDFYKVAYMATTQSILQVHHSKLRFSTSFPWSSFLLWIFWLWKGACCQPLGSLSHSHGAAPDNLHHRLREISRYLGWMLRHTWKGPNSVGIFADSIFFH